MASKAITYVWKVKRPNDEVLVRRLMAAAYQTATKDDVSSPLMLPKRAAVSSSVKHTESEISCSLM